MEQIITICCKFCIRGDQRPKLVKKFKMLKEFVVAQGLGKGGVGGGGVALANVPYLGKFHFSHFIICKFVSRLYYF